VFSHWLLGKALFFRYISPTSPGWLGGQLTPLQYTLLSSNTAYISLNPHIYTYTAYISLIPPHIPTKPASHLSPHIYLHCLYLIHLHSLYLINSPTYTYTACISFIPHIYLHRLHLIYPPTYTYTDCIPFIPTHIPT